MRSPRLLQSLPLTTVQDSEMPTRALTDTLNEVNRRKSVSFPDASIHYVDTGSCHFNCHITRSYESRLLNVFFPEFPTAKAPLSPPLSCFTESRF